MDVLDTYLPPGRDHDVFMNRWVRVEILGRLRGTLLGKLDDEGRTALVTEARRTLRERVPVTADARLSSPADRFAVAILRHGTVQEASSLRTLASNLDPELVLSASASGVAEGVLTVVVDGSRRNAAELTVREAAGGSLSAETLAVLEAEGCGGDALAPDQLHWAFGATSTREAGRYVMDASHRFRPEYFSADTVRGTSALGPLRPRVLLGRAGSTDDADRVNMEASAAGTPAATVLSAEDQRRALIRGYLDHFNRWSGRLHGLSLAAVVAGVVSLASGSALVATLSSIVVLALTVAAQQRAAWLGRFPAPRLILLLAPAVAFTSTGNTVSSLVIVAMALLITVEALLNQPANKLPRIPMANVPGMTDLPTLKRTFKVGYVLLVVAEAAVIALLAYGLPLLAIVPLLAGIALLGYIAFRIKAVRAQHHRMVVAKFDRLAELEPRFLVHWDGPLAGTYQVGMWGTHSGQPSCRLRSWCAMTSTSERCPTRRTACP